MGSPPVLNAPFGSRCFMTEQNAYQSQRTHDVLMHCLALGALYGTPVIIVGELVAKS